MFKPTALSSVDSYKLGHAEQYPANTTKVYSNFTPRSMSHFIVPSEFSTTGIVWFGLQGFLAELQEVWDTTFFDRHVQAALQEAEELYWAIIPLIHDFVTELNKGSSAITNIINDNKMAVVTGICNTASDNITS